MKVLGEDRFAFSSKDLGQFPIQSAQILTNCGEDYA